MAPHGTASSYKSGCRCEGCKTAQVAGSKKYYAANTATIRAKNKAWNLANPDALKVLRRKSKLKTLYGLTEQAYEDMFWALLNSSEFIFNH